MNTHKTSRLSVSFVLTLSTGALGFASSACDDAPHSAANRTARAERAQPAQAASANASDGDDKAGLVEVAPSMVNAPVSTPTLREIESLAHARDIVRDDIGEGDALLRDGRIGEAVVAFRHALYDDDGATTWARLGHAYLAKGDVVHAIPTLEMALVKDPSLIEPRRALVELALKRDDATTARAHVEILVARDGARASTRYLAGKVYMKAEMWNEAVVAFQKTLDLDPANVYAHNNLGYSALQIGKTDDAVRHLEHCLTLAPVKPYMLNNLGVAYERDGRRAEALAAYMRAVELRPSYTNAIVNKNRVSSDMSEEEVTLASDLLDELRRVPPGSTMAAVDNATATEVVD
jgi:tetratricopeptide (TPR) repeat protein